MILNDVLTKQNVITKVLLKDGDKELPKALKVKIMRMRMAYNKIKQQFDSDTQEFTKDLVPEELQTLANGLVTLMKSNEQSKNALGDFISASKLLSKINEQIAYIDMEEGADI